VGPPGAGSGALPWDVRRQETAFNINIQLPGGGTYYVVFDNTFSVFSGKTVTGTLTVTYYVPYS